jgi:hypothetical protein
MPNSNATTPLQAFPTPRDADDPDVPGDTYALAVAIEKRVVGRYTSAANRNSLVTSPQDGQVALLADTRAITVYNSTTSTWQTVYPQAIPTFSSGSSVPSNASGADGDVFYKV